MSSGLVHPVPTATEGAAEKVGAKSVFRVPVGVYVGRSETWVPVKEGDNVAGGNGCEETPLGSRVPAAAPPVAVDGYLPSNN